WLAAPESPPDAGDPVITMFRARAIPSPPRAVGVLGCPGQKSPLTSLARLPVPVVSGRKMASGPAHSPALGRQSMLVCVVGLPTVQARPARGPALQTPPMQRGHDVVAPYLVAVRYACERSVMLIEIAPVPAFAVPLGAVSITLSTQMLVALFTGLGIGRGGPK